MEFNAWTGDGAEWSAPHSFSEEIHSCIRRIVDRLGLTPSLGMAAERTIVPQKWNTRPDYLIGSPLFVYQDKNNLLLYYTPVYVRVYPPFFIGRAVVKLAFSQEVHCFALHIYVPTWALMISWCQVWTLTAGKITLPDIYTKTQIEIIFSTWATNNISLSKTNAIKVITGRGSPYGCETSRRPYLSHRLSSSRQHFRHALGTIFSLTALFLSPSFLLSAALKPRVGNHFSLTALSVLSGVAVDHCSSS
jgi:hypothetical protein